MGRKILMKRLVHLFLLIFILALFETGCSTKPIIKPDCTSFYGPNIEQIYWYPLGDKTRVLGHFTMDESLKKRFEETGSLHLERGQFMGRVQEAPLRFSEKHDDTIRKAEGLYSKKQFQEAAEILYPALHDEPENLFILDALARTLFWIREKRPESFVLYKKLTSSLEDGIKNKESSILIDMWFFEAYRKLGCLYLDRKEYEKAIFEITRAMYATSIIRTDKPPFYEQALSYLCEAYYSIGNYAFAKYFGVNPFFS
jgi:tetratricopeptide (TPR) repeat protein